MLCQCPTLADAHITLGLAIGAGHLCRIYEPLRLIFFLFFVRRLPLFMLPAFYFVFLRCPLSEVHELAPLETEGPPGIFLPCGRLFAEWAGDLHSQVS